MLPNRKRKAESERPAESAKRKAESRCRFAFRFRLSAFRSLSAAVQIQLHTLMIRWPADLLRRRATRARERVRLVGEQTGRGAVAVAVGCGVELDAAGEALARRNEENKVDALDLVAGWRLELGERFILASGCTTDHGGGIALGIASGEVNV